MWGDGLLSMYPISEPKEGSQRILWVGRYGKCVSLRLCTHVATLVSVFRSECIDGGPRVDCEVRRGSKWSSM